MKDVSIYISTMGTIRPSTGYWGYVIGTMVNGEEKTVMDFGEEVEATLNILQLMALFRALGRMRKPSHITVYTDSDYLAGAINSNRLDIWAGNDWRTSKGKPVKNAEIWKEIWQQSMEHELEIKVVQNHPYKTWQQGELKKLAKEAKSLDFPQ